MKHSKECLISFSNTSKLVKRKLGSASFLLTQLWVVGNRMELSSSGLIYYLIPNVSLHLSLGFMESDHVMTIWSVTMDLVMDEFY